MSAPNVVPTQATVIMARRMLREAKRSSGPDAVIELLEDVHPEQVPALIGLLLNTSKLASKMGRPRVPLTLSETQRLRGYTEYKGGSRTDFAVLAYREYQRANQQARRDTLRDPRRSLRSVVSA